MVPSKDAEPRRDASPLPVPLPEPMRVPVPPPAAAQRSSEAARGRDRPPLPAAERRTLRRTGAVAGSLLGVGVVITPPTLAFAVFGFAAASAGWGDALATPATWIAASIAAVGVALLAAGWLISLVRLRHWPRPRRLTAAAFAITAACALLLDALLVLAFLVFEPLGLAPTEWPLIAAGALLAVVLGGAVGMLAWPAMAHVLRPAHPPVTA